MQEIRCEKCNKLLYRLVPDQQHFFTRPEPAKDIEQFEETLIDETLNNEKYLIECKCPRCGTMNTKTE